MIRRLAFILATTSMLTGLAGCDTLKQQAQPGVKAGWDTATMLAAFTYEVVKAGCGSTVYNGRDVTQSLAIGAMLIDTAVKSYGNGMLQSEKALGIRVNRSLYELVPDLTRAQGRRSTNNLARNMRTIRSSDDDVQRTADEISERVKKLTPEQREAFRSTYKSMHIANYFQVHASLGLVIVAATLQQAVKTGGADRLWQIMRSEGQRYGLEGLANQYRNHPEQLFELVVNLSRAYKIYSMLNEAKDYSPELADLMSADVAEADKTIAEIESKVSTEIDAMAASAGGTVETDYKPTGAVMQGFVVSMMPQYGATATQITWALRGIGLFCTGPFATTLGEIVPIPLGPPPAASMNPGDRRKEAQELLIGMGRLQGQATTQVTGPGRTAIRKFQREQGLKVTGDVDAATLDALRAAKAQQPAAGPASSSGGNPLDWLKRLGQ